MYTVVARAAVTAHAPAGDADGEIPADVGGRLGVDVGVGLGGIPHPVMTRTSTMNPTSLCMEPPLPE